MLVLVVITPHACARGKVIGYVIVVVMDTKIAKSGDLARHLSEL